MTKPYLLRNFIVYCKNRQGRLEFHVSSSRAFFSFQRRIIRSRFFGGRFRQGHRNFRLSISKKMSAPPYNQEPPPYSNAQGGGPPPAGFYYPPNPPHTQQPYYVSEFFDILKRGVFLGFYVFCGTQ